MAGAACAVELRRAGIQVRVIDRGRAVGGRMASPMLHDRRVDLGAGYFTVRDPGFQKVVAQWDQEGLARRWTDTFAVLEQGKRLMIKTGPERWATPNGLRSLVSGLLDGIEVEGANETNADPTSESEVMAGLGQWVVLAMPDPQAARLTTVPQAVDYDPVITVVCGFASRTWAFKDAAFVLRHPDIEFVADDGARRGDGAPVLVVHSTAALARKHLWNPDAAIGPMLAGLAELTGAKDPEWTFAHRWRFAKPANQHPTTFAVRALAEQTVWFAGDQWCPAGSPRVESAWRSGTDVANSIAGRA